MKNMYDVEIPNSVLVKNQMIKMEKLIVFEGNDCRMVIEVRYDDQCGNGHNSFSITGSIHSLDKRKRRDSMITGGCIHDEIREYFPEYEKFIKWHLCSADMPMHYLENTMYLAGDKDCHGLKKGEFRQLKDGKTGISCWELIAYNKAGNEVETYKMEEHIDSLERPECPYRLAYRPWGRTGEGKEPELEAARHSAIWEDATLEELTDKKKLLARLPVLMQEFKAAMEELKFVY